MVFFHNSSSSKKVIVLSKKKCVLQRKACDQNGIHLVLFCEVKNLLLNTEQILTKKSLKQNQITIA